MGVKLGICGAIMNLRCVGIARLRLRSALKPLSVPCVCNDTMMYFTRPCQLLGLVLAVSLGNEKNYLHWILIVCLLDFPALSPSATWSHLVIINASWPNISTQR
jgi:hypothetical protein